MYVFLHVCVGMCVCMYVDVYVCVCMCMACNPNRLFAGCSVPLTFRSRALPAWTAP